MEIVVPHVHASSATTSHHLHHKGGEHLLLFEGGKFSCFAVPPLISPAADQVKLCFTDHGNDKWDPRAEQCCLREGGHVHAHFHQGEITEDVLLEQCMDEGGCALSMPWELPSSCLNDMVDEQHHEHMEGCGHSQIAHGDHFDWLVPMNDGSFILNHTQITDDGAPRFIEHGRLVKVGESLGRLKRRPRQLFDLFGYEGPQKKDYVSLPQADEMSKDLEADTVKGTKLPRDVLGSSMQPSDVEKPFLRKDTVNVNIHDDFGAYELQKTTLDVLGICCPSEVPLVKKILEPLPGVKEVSVNVATRTVTVLHDPVSTSDGQLVKALNVARLEASIRRAGEVKAAHKWPSPYTIISGLFVLVAIFHFIFSPLRWAGLGAVAVGSPPIIMRSLVSLRRWVLDINILMLIAVVGAVSLGDYFEAGSIVFLFTLAEWLESRSSDKARLAISAVMNLAPQSAILADNGLKVPVAEVKVGTKLSVKAGDSIPIDGIVISGKCLVDESSLTGESVPVEKEAGVIVWAGTMNMSGYLCVETTALAEDSAVARMARLVEEAQTQRSRTEQLVEKFAKYYTPGVVVVAVAIATIPLAVRAHNPGHWLYLALVLLVVACPCALVISTPVTTTCGIAQAAQMGLIVKGGIFLEALGKLKVVAMDKTGTLTEGHFRVAEVLPLNNSTDLQKLLYWTSCIESKSSHPMASALVAYARLHGVEPSGEVEGFNILTGEGVSGIVDGHHIHIGNGRLANRLGWTEAVDSDILESWSNQGETICWIGVDERPVGIFCAGDQVRPEAVEAVSDMKKLGLHIAMLTGDSMAAANAVHRKLGEIDVHAQLLPADKVQMLRELKKIGMTGMVGDGINDAPALAAADVGIAMGVAGSAVAMETADIALMTNDIRKLAAAVGLGRKSRRKIQQNIFISFATKALIIALAAAGYASLWGAVLADVGTCLVVIFNSMLLLDRKKGHGANGARRCLSNELKGKHDHQEQPKLCSEGGDCCSKSAPLKVVDASPCCKSKRDVSDGLQRLQDPANGGSGSNYQDLQDCSGDCCVAKSCCEVNGKSSSRGMRRRSGHKDTCTKDCQGVECFSAVVSISEEPEPANSSPETEDPCHEAASFFVSNCGPETGCDSRCCRSGGKKALVENKRARNQGHKEACAKDCRRVDCTAEHNCHSSNLKGKPDNHQQPTKCSEGRDCCSKSAPLKVVDCKLKQDVSDRLPRLQDPANGSCSSTHQDLPTHLEICCATSSCCEVNGKSSSRQTRMSGQKDTCTKDCQGIDCFSAVVTMSERPEAANSSSEPEDPSHGAGDFCQMELTEMTGDVQPSSSKDNRSHSHQDSSFCVSDSCSETGNESRCCGSGIQKAPVLNKTDIYHVHKKACVKNCGVDCTAEDMEITTFVMHCSQKEDEPCCGESSGGCCPDKLSNSPDKYSVKK